MAAKKGGLGRGLSSLLGDLDSKPISIFEEKENKKAPEKVNKEAQLKSAGGKAVEKVENPADGVIYIALDDIKPNSKQPRKVFNEEALEELANSIKEYGVIQPVVVRKFKNGYELVVGERRWRAARKAGLKKIPAIVRELDERQNAFVALLENMQREDLNMIEEAQGLEALMSDYGLTQEETAKALGKSRPYVTNALRLLKLPKEVQDLVSEGQLSAGHAKALAGISSAKLQIEIANKAVKESWSVRKIESYSEGNKKKITHSKKTKDQAFLDVEEQLSKELGTKVIINGTEVKGRLEIAYFSREELDRIIDLLLN